MLSLLSDVCFLEYSLEMFMDRVLLREEFGMRLDMDEGGLQSCSGKGEPDIPRLDSASTLQPIF